MVRGSSRCAGAHTITYRMPHSDSEPTRFGFIVSKKVGSAVVRNTVRRRLKAISYELRDEVTPAADIVIRAFPSAASAPFAEMRAEIHRCMKRTAA